MPQVEKCYNQKDENSEEKLPTWSCMLSCRALDTSLPTDTNMSVSISLALVAEEEASAAACAATSFCPSAANMI